MTKKILTLTVGLAVAASFANAATYYNYNKNALLDNIEVGAVFGELDKRFVKGITIKQYLTKPIYLKMNFFTNKKNFNTELGFDLSKILKINKTGTIISFGFERYNVEKSITQKQEDGLDQYQTITKKENKIIGNFYATQSLTFKFPNNMFSSYLAVGNKNTKIGVSDTITFNKYKHLSLGVDLFKRLNYDYKNSTNVLFNINYTF